MTTLSPGLIVSTGFCALSYQPNCVVSMVAGSRCTFPGAAVATATVCAVATSLKIASNAAAKMPSAILDCVLICPSLHCNIFAQADPLLARRSTSRREPLGPALAYLRKPWRDPSGVVLERDLFVL